MSSATVSTVTSTDKYETAKTIGMYVSYAGFTGLFIASIVLLSQYAASTDNWIDLKPRLTPIFSMVGVGTFLFFIGTWLYLLQNTTNINVILLLTASIAIFLSFSSLGVACLTR